MNKKEITQIISGSLLVAGTTVGAGMLGIPLMTAKAGFWPAMCITIFTWAIMLWTGLLYLEATLWMPLGSNLLSMSKRFFGNQGRIFSGAMFLFLYYCLLVAYFAAGAPMLAYALNISFGWELTGIRAYALFGGLFALIVGLGTKWIDWSNMILTTLMVVVYFLLITLGASEVEAGKLEFVSWSPVFFAMPILFSAFGYHNIIPSLCTYFDKRVKPLKLSIIVGTTIALLIYLIWQWLVIGIVPQESIATALSQGQPVTAAMQNITGKKWIFALGQTFAFFAIATSLIGVSFSVVDFLADGLKMERKGLKRLLLSFMTFFPPFILVWLYPSIFDKALGVAGGFGEGILNGLIPIALVWIGLYHKGLQPTLLRGGKTRVSLTILTLVILLVMALEVVNLSH